MRSDRIISMAAIVALLPLVAGGSVSPAATGSVPQAAAEVERIRLHLGKVQSALRARETGGFTADQRARRTAALDWLHEYRQLGLFPHNHTHPGRRVPVFVDEHGTHCAVGYLLKRSGETELIEDVADADNNVRVRELAGNDRFRRWLEETGLTLEEAAWIQPTYDGDRSNISSGETGRAATVYGGIASGGFALYSYLSEPGPSEFQVAGALNAVFSLFHLGVAVRIAGSDGQDGMGKIAVNGVLSAVSLHAALSRERRSRERQVSLRAEALRKDSLVRRGLQISLPEPAWIHGRLGVQFRAVH